jgi:hypothetical protein
MMMGLIIAESWALNRRLILGGLIKGDIKALFCHQAQLFKEAFDFSSRV